VIPNVSAALPDVPKKIAHKGQWSEEYTANLQHTFFRGRQCGGAVHTSPCLLAKGDRHSAHSCSLYIIYFAHTLRLIM